LWSWFRTHDTNKDGKISWEEFHDGMFEHLQDELDTDHLHPTEQIEARKQVESKGRFAALDKNKDGWVAILSTHLNDPVNSCDDCYWMDVSYTASGYPVPLRLPSHSPWAAVTFICTRSVFWLFS
jgi:Ca2+-binding EF-hand superfamily protein